MLFTALALYCFREVWNGGISVVSPVRRDWEGWIPFREWDLRYAIWATYRNARALAHPGTPFFDSGQCYPQPNSLALGHAVFALGGLALPLLAFTSDPVTIYNVVLILLAVTAALSMWLLVTDVTGVPAAGLIAGLVYGFGAAKIGDPDHAFLTDTGWFVLALLFLRRALRAEKPMKDALCFALCASGQLAAGVYPAAGSFFVGLVVTVGLVFENGVSRRLLLPLAAALSVVGMAAYAMYRPYFGMLSEGVLVERGRIFLSLRNFLLRGGLFPGVPLLVGVAVALIGARRVENRDSFALRIALAAAAFVGVFLATGGLVRAGGGLDVPGAGQGMRTLNVAPSALYQWLADWIPGLSIGRGPAYAYGAAWVCLGYLTGLGAATAFTWLVQLPKLTGLCARRRALVAALLVTSVLVPTVVRLPRFNVVRTRPLESEIALFRAIEGHGSQGPILELPLADGLAGADRASAALLLTAYHHRKTSECFASFSAEALSDPLRDAIAKLPSAASIALISGAGFKTIYVPHAGTGARLARELMTASRYGVKPLMITPDATVFDIR